ncbi:MAG: LamG-like jellyroll fold domain-containing protein [Verrucomicrobiota bacterium]
MLIRSLMLGLALVTTARADNTALSFNGTSSFATFGPAPALGASNFTIECWFKRTGTGATTSTGGGGTIAVPLVTKGRGEAENSNVDMNYFLGISNTVLVADFEGFDLGTNHPVKGVTAIANGIWYHAAVTYNGSTWQMFLNGTLETSLTVNQTPRWDSIQHAGLGTAMVSTGTPAGFFAGLLDEVRIWNYARTAQEIADNKSVEITSAPGLLGRWGLNEGAGNSILSTASGAVTGILSNSPAWTGGFQVATVTVVAQGDSWKYFKGTSYPSGWETNGFDDTAWLTGPSGFGYGDNDDSTVLGDMQNSYLTVFTRKEIIITNPAAVTALSLGADYDDGLLAFLNGVEIARRSILAGPISNTTTGVNHEASNGNSSPQPKEYISVPINLLAPGAISTNLLAVSGHNTSLTSSDLSLIIDLTYTTNIVADAVLTRGPYLQLGSHTNMTVRWRTDLAGTSRVQSGTTTNLGTIADDLTVTTEHQVTLRNLAPDTRYYYSIGSTNQFLTGGDTNTFFVTNPTPGTRKPTRVWVLGDSGTKNANQLAVASAYYSNSVNRATDLWLMLGDNVYDAGADVDYDPAIFNVYPATLRTSVLWPTIGNHDTAQSGTPALSLPYFSNFTLPTRGEAGGRASGTENYYSFDYANIHFICLDSMTTTNRAANSVMLQWLQLDLQNLPASQKWLIAFWHHPPYTNGSHNSDTESELIEMRTNAVPILESFGVDLILSGHSHSYERSFLINSHYGTSNTFNGSMKLNGGSGRLDSTGAYMKPNTNGNAGAVYAVAGSSGQISGGGLNHPAMFISLNQLGSMILDIDGDRLDAKFLTSTGVTNDYFTILKGSGIALTPTVATAGEFGPSNGTFTVTRTGATNFLVTVGYTVSGTASNGLDYTVLPGNVTLPAGVTTATITIAPVTDALVEGNETVTLNLATSVTYTVAPASNGTVTIQDLPFDAWRAGKFTLAELSNPAISGELADPDGDGLGNILEYALHLEPKTADASQTLQPAVDANGYLTLIYTRPVSAPDLTYAVEATGGVEGGWSPTGIVETVLSNDGTTKTIQARDAVAMTGQAKRFLRLRVTR